MQDQKLRKRIEVREKVFDDFRMVQVAYGMGNLEQEEARIMKKLRRYDLSYCAMTSLEKDTRLFGLSKLQFLARKNEFVLRSKLIFESISARQRGEKRKCCLMFVEDENWSQRELLLVLEQAKQYYEDFIFIGDCDVLLQSVASFLFDEWGIAVEIGTQDLFGKLHVDFALFLVKEWDGNRFLDLFFDQAYVVAENECNIVRNEEKLWHLREEENRMVEENSRYCYSGLQYLCDAKIIPYSVAVDCFFQIPVFCAKKKISCVAIYCLE